MQLNTVSLPRIDTYWDGQGGVFAGIMPGRDGGPDYALIRGPAVDDNQWQDAVDRAAAIEVDGHKDFRLPYLNELSLLRATQPQHFERTWYWSCEQHPAGEGYAFAQGFSIGNQVGIYKSFTCLGCAVRMIPLW